MRHALPWIGIALALAIPIAAFAADKPEPAKPPTSAASIAIDANNGTVLCEQNARKRLPMASTTKIMTAILIAEHGDLDDLVTISKRASETPYSPLTLLPNEKVPLRDLLHAILMRSANDAAVAAAEHIAGSEPEFVKMMNAKARELGAKHTHFCNPNGLYVKDHYTTAYDLALIARQALKYDVINEVLVSPSVVIDRSISKENALIPNKNRFLEMFDGADGVKTGYTKEAGHCFVGSATRNGMRLITVVLNSSDYLTETANFMTWGFDNFEIVKLCDAGKPYDHVSVLGGRPGRVNAIAPDGVFAVVRKGRADRLKTETIVDIVELPVEEGKPIAHVEMSLDGKLIGTAALVAPCPITKSLIYLPPVRLIVLLGLALGSIYGARYVTATPETNGRARRRVKKGVRRDYRSWEGDR
jgi:D-alanyl-D-alanine carboxypeptidase (penicillin-binding protein 5/6)